jgi:hypothetical protein
MTGMPPPLTVRTNFTIGAQSISSQATATMHATCGKDWNMSRASSVLCAVRTLNFDVSSTSFRVESASPGSGSATISVGRRFTHLSPACGMRSMAKKPQFPASIPLAKLPLEILGSRTHAPLKLLHNEKASCSPFVYCNFCRTHLTCVLFP